MSTKVILKRITDVDAGIIMSLFWTFATSYSKVLGAMMWETKKIRAYNKGDVILGTYLVEEV